MARLRQWMEEKGIQAFITPSTDPHSGEYVPERWKSREWLSGFTGSAGTAVVTLHEAALWTDSRYFLQAAAQLDGSGMVLMKDKVEGTPDIGRWLAERLPEGQRVGVDEWCFASAEFTALAARLREGGVTLVGVGDPFDEIWPTRPGIPGAPVEIHPMEYAGEPAASKLGRIRGTLAARGADALIMPMLDEVAWTLNLRGADVRYNPVFVSYLYIGQNSAVLFVDERKLTSEVRHYLADQGVDVQPYGAVDAYLRQLPERIRVAFQPEKCNHGIECALRNAVRMDCPVSMMKIMKNESEIRGYRSAMRKDGVAMVRWLKWLEEAVPQGGQTELSLSRRLEEFRAEQPNFRGVSFESIMAYGTHGAIVHYDPTPETDVAVEPRGLLLIDSGGQYQEGTTDITRTIPLGPLTDQERRDYTLCLRGFINLGRAVFPRGTYGTQLDALAREPMWKYGINYLHGTGHGVGSYLNVHEGPHQFRMNYMPTPLLPRMTITNEPGIYIEGSHGVRHENTMLVVEVTPKDCDSSQGCTYGPYYGFEHLTLCPISTAAIVVDMLQKEERAWFNAYQQHVYNQLAPHLDEAHRAWLLQATRAI